MAKSCGTCCAPMFLRIALGVVFVWAGLGKVCNDVSVKGDDAAALANMGVITPPAKAPPPKGLNPEAPHAGKPDSAKPDPAKPDAAKPDSGKPQPKHSRPSAARARTRPSPASTPNR